MSNLDNYIEELKKQIEAYGNLTEDEIVRFIYLSLGKKIVFDTNFLFASTDEKIRIYDVGEDYNYDYNNGINVEKLKVIDEMVDEDKWGLICNYIAPLIKYIGNKLGLRIEIVTETPYGNMFPHSRNLVKRSDGTHYFIDLQADLCYIHYNARTHYFGMREGTYKNFFDRDELEKMDLKLGYISKDRFYSDDYLDLLKTYISYFDSFSDKLKFVLENYSPYPGYNTGFLEHKYYIKKNILEKIFDIDDREKYDYLDCRIYNNKKIIKDNNGTRVEYDITAKGLIYDLEGNVFYALSEEEERYKQISFDELAKMIVEEKLNLPSKYKNKEGFPGYNALEEAIKRYRKQKPAYDVPCV